MFFRIKYFAIKKVMETEDRTLNKSRETCGFQKLWVSPQFRLLPIIDESKKNKKNKQIIRREDKRHLTIRNLSLYSCCEGEKFTILGIS